MSIRLAYPIVFAAALGAAGCNNHGIGTTDFVSAPPGGQGAGSQGGDTANGGAGAGTPATGAGGAGGSGGGTTTTPRTVEETDLYRLEGNRLYYLNGYRGLMVFDVTNVDQPKLLGRSPIFGSPVDMIVQQRHRHRRRRRLVRHAWTTARRSTARSCAASTPPTRRTSRSLGEAKLGGWVRDDRVVGDVLYAVSEDYGWELRLGLTAGGVGTSSTQSRGDRLVGELRQQRRSRPVGHADVRRLQRRLQRHAQLDPARARRAGADQHEHDQTELRVPRHLRSGRRDRRSAASIVVNGQRAGLGRRQRPLEPRLRRRQDGARHRLQPLRRRQRHERLRPRHRRLHATPTRRCSSRELTIPSTGWSVAARFDSGRLYLSPDSY